MSLAPRRHERTGQQARHSIRLLGLPLGERLLNAIHELYCLARLSLSDAGRRCVHRERNGLFMHQRPACLSVVLKVDSQCLIVNTKSC
jgi:hypothetical protein